MTYPFPGMNSWLEDARLFSVRQPIPLIPIPLQAREEEPLIDLGAILRSIYERVRYDLVIDYGKPPVPALDKADMAWAQEQLPHLDTSGSD